MKRFLGLLLLISLILLYIGTLGNALAIYSWTGKLNVGDELYINNMSIKIDRDRTTNITAAIVDHEGEVFLIKEGEKKEINGIEISVNSFNDYAIIHISSKDPFEVKFTPGILTNKILIENLEKENQKLKEQVQNLTKENKQLKDENAQLKRRVSDLEKQLKEAKAQDISKLQMQINNLTKENRELKEKIANQTQLINSLKGENNFLKQQNNEYKSLISTLLEEQAQKSEQSYIEKAKKEKLWGSILLKTIITAGGIVLLAGFLLYRGKRGWEYAKL